MSVSYGNVILLSLIVRIKCSITYAQIKNSCTDKTEINIRRRKRGTSLLLLGPEKTFLRKNEALMGLEIGLAKDSFQISILLTRTTAGRRQRHRRGTKEVCNSPPVGIRVLKQ